MPFTMPFSSSSIIFAGGGSGGHISPGLAIAERLGEIDPACRAVFACSNRQVDQSMLSEARVEFETLPSSPFSLRPRALGRFAADFLRSRTAAGSLLRRRQAARVVAMGGFVAAPVVAAAVRSGIPVTLVNLDAPPGKANRWIARRCQHVVSAIEVKQPQGFAHRVVGMPVRRCAVAPGSRQECRRRLALDEQRRTLLVTGASQGARTINELMVELVRRYHAGFEGWQVLHLCGSGDAGPLRAEYEHAGVPARVEPFVHGMGVAWGAADLAVSRAGASSVAEAWRNAVPTVFLPYPFHRDQHQANNARPMVDAGGAVIEPDHIQIGANLDGAGATILALLADAGRRGAMRGKLESRPAPDAAETIARLILESSA